VTARAITVAGLLLAIASCKRSEPAKTTKTVASVAFEEEAKTIVLPKSSFGGPNETATARVLLSGRHLLVLGDTFPIVSLSPDAAKDLAKNGLPAETKRSGPNDLLISPLREALDHDRKALLGTASSAAPVTSAEIRAVLAGSAAPDRPAARFVLMADRATPYRAVVEIVYTAAQAQYADLRIAVTGPSGLTAIPLSTPPPPLGGEGLRVTAVATKEGISLKTAQGNLAPGCDNLGPGVAVPKQGSEHDYPAFASCLQSLKQASTRAAADRVITVTASPDVDLQTIVTIIDTARGSSGDDFAKAQLGVAR
jgi:biopolymer transport protein ExbD